MFHFALFDSMFAKAISTSKMIDLNYYFDLWT